MKYTIKIKDIEFKAKNKEEAEDLSLDIVNDIGKNAEYEVVKVDKKSV
jgi:hypothetical protein